MDRNDSTPDYGTRRPEAAQPPQAEKKHPDEWERDLNPNRMAGQNIGLSGDLPNANDFPDLRRSLGEFAADEARAITIVPPGSRLKQGATYLDLSTDHRREFTATGDQVAGPDDRLVPKSDVPYTLWNRLRGIDDPERTT